MAFSMATFLHKEYGQHRSPIYSIAGYSLASMTGIFRQLNDRHWMSDVLVGAGVGIWSMEFAYLLGDLHFKEKGRRPPALNCAYDKDHGKPHFLDFRWGYSLPLGDLREGIDGFKSTDGFKVGFEGAWFFTPTIGAGLNLSFTGNYMHEVHYDGSFTFSNDTRSIEIQPFGTRFLSLGPYFNFDLPKNYAITAKFMAGPALGVKGLAQAKLNEQTTELIGTEYWPIAEYEQVISWNFATGVGIRKMVGRNLALRLFTEYTFAPMDVNVYALKNVTPEGEFDRANKVNAFSFESQQFVTGLSISAMVW